MPYNIVMDNEPIVDQNLYQPPQPTRLRQAVGAVAGVSTGAAVYGTEAAFGYVVAEQMAAFVQSGDKVAFGSAVFCIIIILLALERGMRNNGELAIGLAASGLRAGQAVNDAIVRG